MTGNHHRCKRPPMLRRGWVLIGISGTTLGGLLLLRNAASPVTTTPGSPESSVERKSAHQIEQHGSTAHTTPSPSSATDVREHNIDSRSRVLSASLNQIYPSHVAEQAAVRNALHETGMPVGQWDREALEFISSAKNSLDNVAIISDGCFRAGCGFTLSAKGSLAFDKASTALLERRRPRLGGVLIVAPDSGDGGVVNSYVVLVSPEQ